MNLSKENKVMVSRGKKFEIRETRDGWTLINPNGSLGESYGSGVLSKLAAEKAAEKLNAQYC